jgi:RNA polymerase sigma-70 factor (ECF subfamily)
MLAASNRSAAPMDSPPDMAQTARHQEELGLLERVAARDRSAFETLYHLYYPRLFAYTLKMLRRPEMVEEVVNDVMLVVWQSAGRFEGRSRPSTWLFGITYRQALKALARHGRRGGDHDELPEPLADPGEGPERRVQRRELRDRLDAALASLSVEQRAVVELTFYNGFSYPEVAEVLGCPVNTVKTRMFYARHRLRRLVPDLAREV